MALRSLTLALSFATANSDHNSDSGAERGQQLLTFSQSSYFGNLADAECEDVFRNAPRSGGHRVHVVTNGANLEDQMNEFFAYYLHVLMVDSLQFYHHIGQQNGDPSRAKSIAEHWGVEYFTYNGTDEHECMDSARNETWMRAISSYQCTVLRRGIKLVKQRTYDMGWDWVLYVDIDEFVSVPHHKSLSDYVASIGSNSNAIRFPQYLFGAEGISKQDGMVTLSHLHPINVFNWVARQTSAKTNRSWPAEYNRYQKAAFRLDAADICRYWVHGKCNVSGVRMHLPHPEEARVHHYMILDQTSISKAFWGEKLGIPEKMFRELVQEDIDNEIEHKVDLEEDVDWTGKARFVEHVLKCDKEVQFHCGAAQQSNLTHTSDSSAV